MGQFMEYVARSSTVAEVPAARVAYLGVLTSLASGPQGAQVTATMLEAKYHCTDNTVYTQPFHLGQAPCVMMDVTGADALLQIMFQQLRPGNSYAKISWQDLFAAMKVYCERYSPGPEQQVTLDNLESRE